MLEIVIEIGIEQIWLFQCILFHYIDRLTICITETVTDLSESAMLIFCHEWNFTSKKILHYSFLTSFHP